MATAIQQLIGQDVFGFLKPEQIAAISKASKPAAYKAGETVYIKGAKAQFLHLVLEGQVTLRFPGAAGISMFLEQLGPGALFGLGSLGHGTEVYMVTAQALTNCKILKIDAAFLRRVMDEDPRVGYATEKRICELYFKRYVDAMQKLHAILMTFPLEPQ